MVSIRVRCWVNLRVLKRILPSCFDHLVERLFKIISDQIVLSACENQLAFCWKHKRNPWDCPHVQQICTTRHGEKCTANKVEKNSLEFCSDKDKVTYLILICSWIRQNCLECAKQRQLEQHGWSFQVHSYSVKHLNDRMVCCLLVLFEVFQ